MTPTNPPDSAWLAQQLSELLSSVNIEVPPGSGHGPMNPFATKFYDLFARDATGRVYCGNQDLEGLRKALLDIQKTWDPTTGKVTPAEPPKPHEIAAEMTWIYRKDHNTSLKEVAMVFATTIEEHGNPMIKFLELDGEKTGPPSN